MAADYEIPEHVEVVDPADLPEDDPDYYGCEEAEENDGPALVGGALGFGATSHQVLATWIAAQFDKWGVKYKVVAGAKDRGRPLSAGRFDPNGLLIHHTGSKSSASNPHPSLGTVTNGRSDLRGPLCQISTDYDGVTYIVACGRANHAGKARATMGNPAGDGNAMYVGNEVQTNGTQKMPQAQYDALVLSSAAIIDYLGHPEKLGLHATTSLSGKWDLGAGNGKVEPYDLNRLRADVVARLKAGPPSSNTPAARARRTGVDWSAPFSRYWSRPASDIAVDTSFGPATEAAVKAFQTVAPAAGRPASPAPPPSAAHQGAQPPRSPSPTTTPAPAPTSTEGPSMFLVQLYPQDPVYKSDGFQRVHVTREQRDALLAAGVKLTRVDTQEELDAFGPEPVDAPEEATA